VSLQVEDGVINTAGYYDTIIGCEGSPLELTLSTLFYTNYKVSTIPYEYYERYSIDKSVKEIYPFASGDSYRNAKIVGTVPEYLNNFVLKEGKVFTNVKEAVVGEKVSRDSTLKVGDTFTGTHGSIEGGHAHEEFLYTVTGILKKTGKSTDNVIFTLIDSVWAVHEYGEDEHAEESAEHSNEKRESHSEGVWEDEEHEHHKGELTAILLRTDNLSSHTRIVNELKKEAGVQAINPATELRKLLDSMSLGRDILYIMAVFMILMAVIIIYVTTMAAVADSKQDIILMRLIGISRKTISFILVIQTLIVSVVSAVLAYGANFLLLYLINGFSSGNFGIVIDPLKHYPGEGGIILLILVLNILATTISLIPLYRQDPLEAQ
jgi:putative ABC transport system permease protein